MKTTDGELISMLLDGETPAESRTRSVSLVLDGDPQARETFARYRLIGDLMRDESMRIVPVADWPAGEEPPYFALVLAGRPA